jgi:hypothetical protein
MPINVFTFNPLRLDAERKFVNADSSDESRQFHVSVAPLRHLGKKVGRIHFDTKVLHNGLKSVVQADATLMINQPEEVIRASLLWQAVKGNHQVPSCVSDQVLSSTGRKARVAFTQAKGMPSVTVTSPPTVLVTTMQYVSTITNSSATLQKATIQISDTTAPSNYYYRLYLVSSGARLLNAILDGAKSTTLVLNELQSNVAYKLVVSISPLFGDYEISTTMLTPQTLPNPPTVVYTGSTSYTDSTVLSTLSISTSWYDLSEAPTSVRYVLSPTPPEASEADVTQTMPTSWLTVSGSKTWVIQRYLIKNTTYTLTVYVENNASTTTTGTNATMPMSEPFLAIAKPTVYTFTPTV